MSDRTNVSDSLKYWALTLHLRPHQVTQRHRAVVLAEDYDALAARLAEAEALLTDARDSMDDEAQHVGLVVRIDAFLAKLSATHREDGSHG